MPEPTSWLLLEPGVRVVTAEGEELGKVKEILGEPEADIFHGLIVTTGSLLGESRFVPAELVDLIDAEAVRLNISADRAARLEAG